MSAEREAESLEQRHKITKCPVDEARSNRARREATRLRNEIPEGMRAHGVFICGAYIGTDEYVKLRLHEQTKELCGDPGANPPILGSIEKSARSLADVDAHAAHVMLQYSYQSRTDYILATHYPSDTRDMAARVDETIRRVRTMVYNADLMDTTGKHIRQNQGDLTFTRDRINLKVAHNGGGGRPHACLLYTSDAADE